MIILKRDVADWFVTLDWISDCFENLYQKYGDIKVHEDGEGKAIKLGEAMDELEGLVNELDKELVKAETITINNLNS